jgi:MFS family permease
MNSQQKTLSSNQILLFGALVVTLSMGIRHGFGLWLQPITQDQGWSRETFSFAIAIQNLSWGIGGIFAGMLADRFGAFKVLIGGGLLYSAGLWGMAHTTHPLSFTLATGVLIGLAQAGTTYAVVYGVIGRNISADKRSMAMGIAAAAGSFGQFLMLPIEGLLISKLGWQEALSFLSMLALLIVPLAFALKEPGFSGGSVKREQSIMQAFTEALKLPSFQLLMAGYFVCGFQVVFIGVHLPSYLKDKGLDPQVASYALALVALFNVVGTYMAGQLGQTMLKKHILAGIYLARSIVIAIFLIAPLSPLSVYIFAAFMGFLWLSTVPPTNAIVAQIFGLSHFSMLSGFVFFSHQIGSFMGVWLGGFLFDKTGNYNSVWAISIVLGILAFLANLPIKENALLRAESKAA